MQIIIFFEVNGLATDEQGNPCPCGLSIDIGESDVAIPYEEVVANVNPDYEALASWLHRNPEDFRIITPEEYREKYGDEDEEEED